MNNSGIQAISGLSTIDSDIIYLRNKDNFKLLSVQGDSIEPTTIEVDTQNNVIVDGNSLSVNTPSTFNENLNINSTKQLNTNKITSISSNIQIGDNTDSGIIDIRRDAKIDSSKLLRVSKISGDTSTGDMIIGDTTTDTGIISCNRSITITSNKELNCNNLRSSNGTSDINVKNNMLFQTGNNLTLSSTGTLRSDKITGTATSGNILNICDTTDTTSSINLNRDTNLGNNKNLTLQGTGKITTPNILVSGLTSNKLVLTDASKNLISSLYTDSDYARLAGDNTFSGQNSITGGLTINTSNQTINLNNSNMIREIFRFFPPNYQSVGQGQAVNPQTLANTTINGSQYADGAWNQYAYTPPADGTIPNGQPYYFRNIATYSTTFEINRTNLSSSVVLTNSRVIIFIYNGHTSLYEFLGVVHNSSVPISNQFNSRDNSFTLPSGRGTNNQILTTSGAGATSWSSNLNISNLNVSSLTGNRILLTDASKNITSSLYIDTDFPRLFANNIFTGTTNTFSNVNASNLNLSSLTGSRLLLTDASKNITSSLYIDTDFPRLIANNTFTGSTNTFSNVNASNLNLSSLTGSRLLLTDASKNITSSLYIDTDFPRLIANNSFTGATNTFSGSIRSNIHTATATSTNFSLGESGDTGTIVSYRDLYIGTTAGNKALVCNAYYAHNATNNIVFGLNQTSGSITIGNTTPAVDSGTLTINKNITVATNKNLTLQGTGKITTPNLLVSGLTASKLVLTDANDNLISSSFTDTDFARLTANNTISGNNLYSGNSTFSGITWINTTNQIIDLNNSNMIREIFRFYPPNYQTIGQGQAVNPQTLSNTTINGSQYSDGAWNSSAFTPANDGVVIPNGQPYYFRNIASTATNFENNRTNLTGPVNLTNGRIIIFIYNAHTSLYEFLGVIHNSSVPSSLQFNSRDNSFTLPTGRGTNNQILTTNGTGATSWSSNVNASNLNLSSLTANRLLLTDGSKNLISSSLTDTDLYTKTQVNNLDYALSEQAKRDGEYGFTEIPIKRIRIKQVANIINLTEIQLWTTFYSINGQKYSQNIVNGVDVTMTMSSNYSNSYPESMARDNNFNTFLHTNDGGTQYVDINLTHRWYYSNIECLVIYNRDSSPYLTYNSVLAGRITNADVEFYDEYSQLITYNKITTLGPHFIKYVFNQSAGDVGGNTATDSTLYPIANTGSMSYNTAKHVVQLTKGLFSRNKEVNSVINFNAFQNFYNYIDQYIYDSYYGVNMRTRFSISRNFASFTGDWANITVPSNLYTGAQDNIWSIWETNANMEGAFIAQNGETAIISNPADNGSLSFLDEDSPSTWVGWRISGVGVITASSDRRLKEEITPIIKDDILDVLSKIEIVNYKLKPPSEEKRFKNGKKRRKYEEVHMGVIAQDVRKEIKDVVIRESEDGYWTVKYQDLTYYFHLGTQELIKENKILKERVQQLEEKLNTLNVGNNNTVLETTVLETPAVLETTVLEERIKKLEDFINYKFGMVL
jgi:hypothetical protein